MIIEKLFQKYRKIEPTSIFVLRNFVLILLLIALLEYTWVIIWGIYNDNPIIQNSLEERSYVPAPGGVHDCNQYIMYLYEPNFRAYEGIFATEDLMFSAIPNNGISSLQYLTEYFYLKDFFERYDKDQFQNHPLTNSKFPETVLHLNQYQLAVNSSFKVKIKRRRKELMVKSWENYLGISTKRESVPYLTSTLETFPLLNDPEFPTLLTKIIIEPQLFIVHVETEKRTKTILSSLGLIGGIWGFAATIYAILFGTIPIKPWGLIQKYGFKINKSVQVKLKDTLGFIPLVQRPKTNNLNNYELKRRLDSLQLFLTEYVVDVQYLKEIYKANINNKGTP
ncbi:hypothetical protein F8M41_024923 [Gigaspora margarita]|uniref:Uncharacterized protein n=1 Tax=Gigaspora margarita TaxID=4874 RepID=A0A8H4B0A3_GIGMA|nr:hypothetical protein F8M41_024923 [Gigaspora margarita]